MSLNIKDERTHDLVRELAERTGTTQTAAVRDAVQQRLNELTRSGSTGDDERRRRRIQRLLDDFRADLTPEDRERMLRADDWLYDERGLPR